MMEGLVLPSIAHQEWIDTILSVLQPCRLKHMRSGMRPPAAWLPGADQTAAQPA